MSSEIMLIRGPVTLSKYKMAYGSEAIAYVCLVQVSGPEQQEPEPPRDVPPQGGKMAKFSAQNLEVGPCRCFSPYLSFSLFVIPAKLVV